VTFQWRWRLQSAAETKDRKQEELKNTKMRMSQSKATPTATKPSCCRSMTLFLFWFCNMAYLESHETFFFRFGFGGASKRGFVQNAVYLLVWPATMFDPVVLRGASHRTIRAAGSVANQRDQIQSISDDWLVRSLHRLENCFSGVGNLPAIRN
jgi:hypothetical protein